MACPNAMFMCFELPPHPTDAVYITHVVMVHKSDFVDVIGTPVSSGVLSPDDTIAITTNVYTPELDTIDNAFTDTASPFAIDRRVLMRTSAGQWSLCSHVDSPFPPLGNLETVAGNGEITAHLEPNDVADLGHHSLQAGTRIQPFVARSATFTQTAANKAKNASCTAKFAVKVTVVQFQTPTAILTIEDIENMT